MKDTVEVMAANGGAIGLTLMQANELVNVLTRMSPKNSDKWQKILNTN